MLHAYELPGTEHIAWIREQLDDSDRASLDIDLTVDVLEATLVLVGGAVGEDQLGYRRTLVEGDRRELVKPLQARLELLLGRWKDGADRIDFGHCGQHDPAHSDEIADLRESRTDDPIDRRSDLCVTEVDLCLVDSRFRRSDLRLCGKISLESIVEVLLAEGALSDKGRETLHVELGLSQVSLRLGELCPRLCQGRLIGTRVDLEEKVAFLDEAPFLIMLFLEISLYLRPDLRVR